MAFRILGCIALIALAPTCIAAVDWHGSLVVRALPALARFLDLVIGENRLAWPFFLAIALVVPAVGLWTLKRGDDAQIPVLVLFVASMIVVLLARSVGAFALAWECMTLTSAFLVAAHHDARYVRRAAFTYLITSQIGTMCIIASLGVLGTHAASFRFADIERASAALPASSRDWALALALIGFGSKAGLVPLHFWLPRAHPAAPASASAVLSGLMLAVAIYGLATVFVVLAAPAPAAFGLALLAAGSISVVMGGLYAAVSGDMKRLLAFSSIENIGIIAATLGLAVLAAALNLHAIAAAALVAALLQTIAHAVYKALLFLAAGTVYESAGTTDLERLGGLSQAMRYTAFLAFIGCMAATALPPTIGFASEWLVFQAFIGALLGGPAMLRAAAALSLAALATGSGLAALAYVKMFGIGFLGAGRSAHVPSQERFDVAVAGVMWLGLAALAFGVAPALIGPMARAFDAVALPNVPVFLAAFPAAFAGLTLLYAKRLRVRSVPVWTCGSPVTRRSQYTSGAFANPIAIIYRALLLPQRRRIVEAAASPWFPRAISSVTKVRYVVDEAARALASIVQRAARAMRIVQGGLLRVYLAYAVLALVAVLVTAK